MPGLTGEEDTVSFELFRNEKNILSTKIIDHSKFDHINNISIKYDSNPEIIIEKSIYGKNRRKRKTGLSAFIQRKY